jgi:hypothetical protein
MRSYFMCEAVRAAAVFTSPRLRGEVRLRRPETKHDSRASSEIAAHLLFCNAKASCAGALQ